MLEMMQLEHRDIHKKEYKIEQQLPDERVYIYYQDDQLKLWRREKFPKQKKKENEFKSKGFTTVRTHLYFLNEGFISKLRSLL
jgi:tRNA G26 N,N-dimethylase Trm1